VKWNAIYCISCCESDDHDFSPAHPEDRHGTSGAPFAYRAVFTHYLSGLLQWPLMLSSSISPLTRALFGHSQNCLA
jgi:hypothetical protein